jgi:hypothetical protein
MSDFGHSISPDQSAPSDVNQDLPSVNSHYLALEFYDKEYGWESDVFSFRLILYELVAGQPAFPKTSSEVKVASPPIARDKRPIIPDFVLPAVQRLICKWWKRDRWRRPVFDQILDWLEAMKFKLIPIVNSSKLFEFVKNAKDWEETNDVLTARAR